eukprot:CAMPEP_0113528794 /NCGR_PEP_ID=MMETSP0015_2-20120614/2037_1 /TAXON_ID=2838 /ORGANISM="Odontella" /LENGTH=418 /DNA_ID=CAMNT_0000427355 /DNA_START=20 /DNA_END=1273 /DNA_ORIENTATION=+ /assembly_acc=CAM_ASM_000160
MPFPTQILFDFFKEATLHLEENHYEGEHEPATADNERDLTPPTLETQRQRLLRIQVDALQSAIERYDRAKSSPEQDDNVSLEDAQLVLREIGSQNFSKVNAEDKEEIVESMAAMNDAARLAFARSVLVAEIMWEDNAQTAKSDDETMSKRALIDSSCGGGMCRSAIVEFCALCNAVVSLPEVQEHLKSGSDLKSCLFGCSNQTPDDGKRQAVPALLEQLHRKLFRAVGYDSDFGSSEMKRKFFPQQNTKGDDPIDSELAETFAEFLSIMRVTVTKAMLAGSGEASDQFKNLSDVKEGGVTRVVSVDYSEKIIGTQNGEGERGVPGAPLPAKMEGHGLEQKMKQLSFMQKAAALQKKLQGELLSMDSDERDAMLVEARNAHESMLEKAQKIPPGPQRMAFFLQGVDPEQQRLLAIHKVW